MSDFKNDVFQIISSWEDAQKRDENDFENDVKRKFRELETSIENAYNLLEDLRKLCLKK